MTRTRQGTARAALALAAGVALVASVAAPAQASSMSLSKSSGRVVMTSWLEVGELPGGVPGNIHFGSMSVEDLGRGNASIFGDVVDLTCPEGVIPEDPWGGGHGEEPRTDGCVHEGVRFIEGGDVTFTIDNKLGSAKLTGTLAVFGHDGPSGSPRANIVWTGVGDVYKSTFGGTETFGNTTYRYRYSFTGRAATVSGAIGAMVFDDVEGEWSTAEMGTYRQMDQSRTR